MDEDKTREQLIEELKELRRQISGGKQGGEEIRSVSRFPDENPHPVMRVSNNCDLLYANRSSLPMLKAWDRQVGQTLPDYLCRITFEALSSGTDREIEVECGESVFSLIFTPITDAGYVNIYGKDITALKMATIELQAAHDELERRVKSTEAQLRQAQKMEAVGQLAGGVAHDFNNMITVLQGNTDLALTKIGEDEPVYRNLKEIRRITGKAAALTRQLLTFSRHQPMEKDIMNINGCVEDMSKMLKRLIGENISLEIELSPDLWNINADPGQLEQLVMNLVVNARDAMQGGGRLIIKTANVDIDKAYCDTYRDGECREGRFVRISVEDTGTGMDDYIRSHIFEPFFTTKGAEKGTGLGLAVVYGIVKGHNGWIDVYSEVGKGTVFKIYLPPVFADIEQKRGEDGSEEIRGGQEGVLAVEDEEDLRELAKMMLEMHGYKVFVASSYEEAVSVYKENGVNIDVLFTDMMLTGRSGIELSEELKRIRPELRVLFSSGYSDEHFQLPANEKNEYSFLEKPYTLADLLKAVRGILDRK